MTHKESVLARLNWAFSSFGQDLAALPEDAFDKGFGEKTRTVADIVYEVNLVNDHIGMTIRDEDPFEWPEGGWLKAPEGEKIKDVVIANFEKSRAKTMETAESFSEEDLLKKIQTDQGDSNILGQLYFIAWHVGYHSGQLNYIQTLIGDDGWHWS
ncbi:MAG: DinB family protein [Fimbriimonadaceae bacterium]